MPDHFFAQTLHISAILTGSFLSGSMLTIPLLAIPVLLDTTTSPHQLLHQWVRMFHYGHRGHPSLAAITLSLYALAAFQRRGSKRPWKRLVLAGLVTVVMTLFTWVVMVPTNTVIFGLAGGGGVGFEEVRGLVVKWGVMHFVRSFFPLIGAVVGIRELVAG
ncbi:hypothetical protein BJX61DRAFT_534945 [Aspergillus egyptiacus]|nr:hypothetical protein BJX61DRAFT_534945 [Aspergillus egyptiacus]